MNIAIVGSRDFDNYPLLKEKLLFLLKEKNIQITKIISGGASGVDSLAEKFANQFKIPIEVIKADWSQGKQAGPIRNSEIIKKSDVVIAFWDGKSKGTADSIKKAKSQYKKTFVFSILNGNQLSEGVSVDPSGNYVFDFKQDNKDDIIKLKFNDKNITTRTSNGFISYFSFKSNKQIDKTIRKNFLLAFKKKLVDANDYERVLNKAVIGLFNSGIKIDDVDLILIPESASSVNFDLATKIKAKLPNALFLKDGILKNETENIQLDVELMNKHNLKPETIAATEKMVINAIVNGVFSIKKINPRFKKYVINYLKLEPTERKLYNGIFEGKVLVVDDYIGEGTTFREIDRMINKYSPNEVIFYSLFG